MKLVDLCEAIYGKCEVVEDPETGAQWLVKRGGVVVQSFPYHYRDEADKTLEKKNAIKWARAQDK